MILSINNQRVYDIVQPRYAGKELIVAIDSSKSNSAMAVADNRGNLIDYIELNGKTDGTAEEDTLHLCQVERETLKVIFQGAKFKYVGIENIITKRTEKKKTGNSSQDNRQGRNGMTEHESRFKITAVFMSFISFFQDNFNITPELINNWSWKASILPEQFRHKDVHKGSLEYFKSINSKYKYCTDDVTDAICILMYLCKIHNVKTGVEIKEPELSSFKHKVILTCKSFKTNRKEELFYVNENLTLEQNINTMSSRIGNDPHCVAVAEIRTAWINWDDLYKYCCGTFSKRELVLKLIVVNEV